MVTFIADKEGSVSLESSRVSIPGDRHFREAWALSETGDVITEDLAEAKILFKNRVRSTRQPLLEALDVEYLRSLEEGASTDSIVAKKQALRDAPSNSEIDNASDTSALKAAWDTVLLGESPYG